MAVYFIEILTIIAGTVTITWGLIAFFEKMICKLMKQSFHPVVILAGALTMTYTVLGIFTYFYLTSFYAGWFLAAGLVVVLNRYWLGHFSDVGEESSSFEI